MVQGSVINRVMCLRCYLRNAKDAVDSILAATGLAANASVEIKGVGRTTLGEALTTQLDITGLSRKIVSAWQAISGG